MSPSEIDLAIQCSFDGTLDDDGCLELRNILKSDPAARALYYEYAGLHQALSYQLSRRHMIDTDKWPAVFRIVRSTLLSRRYTLISAAAAVVLLGVMVKTFFVPEEPAMATFRCAAGSIFSLEHFGTDGDPAPGELGENSTMRLTQGSAEIHLRNGSRAVVLAPAKFSFRSDMRMILSEGSAWFHVSEMGHGFQVTTPEMLVTDLGTEFGVVSTPGSNNEIHVFTGEVRAEGTQGLKTTVSLTQQQAMVCDPTGRFATIKIRPEEFLSTLPSQVDKDLLTNGNFEVGNHPPNHDYGVPATAGTLPFWNFGKNVSVARKTGTERLGYGLGNISIVSSTANTQVGFNDDTAGQPAAEDVSLSQTFTTVPGTRYVVAFEMGAIFYEAHPMEITASVHPDSSPDARLGQLIERRAPSEGNGYNPPASFTFTATSTASTLVFTETSTNSLSADPALDNISVTALP